MYQSQQAMLLIIKKNVKNVVPMLINHILQNISSYYPFWQGDLCHVLMYNPRRASIAVILLVILVISKLIVFYRHKSKANQPKRPPNKIQKKKGLTQIYKRFLSYSSFCIAHNIVWGCQKEGQVKATEGTCCFWWPVTLWPKETPTHTIYDSIILRTFSFIFTIIIYGSASALEILFCDSMCFRYINAFVPSCVGTFLPFLFFIFLILFIWYSTNHY